MTIAQPWYRLGPFGGFRASRGDYEDWLRSGRSWVDDRDEYDPHVAFDDLEDFAEASVNARDLDDAGGDRALRHMTARLAAARRIAPLLDVYPADSVVGLERFSVLGDDFPIFNSLRQGFAAAISEPKAMRLDDENSFADIARRLAALEAAVADHVSDDHGHGRVARVEDELHQHLAERARIHLPLPAWCDGRVLCWQDGPNVICTVKVQAPDGRGLFATAGEPLAAHVEEAGTSIIGADAHPHVLPGVTRARAGLSLLSDLSRAAPHMLVRARRAPAVFVAVPRGDATVASAMELLQRCQQGDLAACREVNRMMAMGNGRLFATAKARLGRGIDNKRGRKWWRFWS
jgi:hypothetical protein